MFKVSLVKLTVLEWGLLALVEGMWIVDFYFHHFHSICYSIYIRLMYPEGWCKLLENICRALVCENKGNCHPLNPILPCHIAHKWTYTGDNKMHSTNTQCYNSNILLDFPNGLCGYGANEHIPIIP